MEKRQLEKAARAAARAQKAAGGDVQPAVLPPAETPTTSQDATPPVAASPVIAEALDVSPAEEADEVPPVYDETWGPR